MLRLPLLTVPYFHCGVLDDDEQFLKRLNGTIKQLEGTGIPKADAIVQCFRDDLESWSRYRQIMIRKGNALVKRESEGERII